MAATGAKEGFRVRAPGRVNLIGEHVDYCGLPVLPAAIQRAVTIELRPRADRRIVLANADPRFEGGAFELGPEIAPAPAGHWTNYVRAAARELSGRFGVRRGFDGLVAGDVPAAAGLSSSSALVVASALALLASNELEVEPLELMELCARAERFVGTESGGMDQAIAIGGRAGHAVRIDFDPLRLEPIPVPAGWRFVLANSFVEARKSGAAQAGYNARVRECARALALLAPVLRERGVPASWRGVLAGVGDEGREDLAARLPDPLRRRFRHVVGEGARVERAVLALRRSDLAAFGALLDASHASLRDEYEVSRPELDALVEAAKRHGAAGARLTGAGFGGCVVALAREDGLERLLAGLRAASPRGGEGLLVVEPSAGASVTRG